MNEQVYQTIKSAETEDWLDYHYIRPFSYYWAKAFNRFDIHPNTVTILSMIIGAASCVFFAHDSLYYGGWEGLGYNLIAIMMLMVADILDCTDGQLARMSGKKSRLGRILDGMAGFVWFIPIYLAIVWRFSQHHSLEASLIVLVLSFISGFSGISSQQRLADYYIQAHLLFLKGEKGSELDNSLQQQEIYNQMDASVPFYERWFQKTYIGYTRKQEKSTPQFQRLLAALCEKYGDFGHAPQYIHEELHRSSLRLMTLNGLLTFNFRSFWLFLFCLIDLPACFFLFEIVCMGLLTEYIRRRHENFCRRVYEMVTKEAQ